MGMPLYEEDLAAGNHPYTSNPFQLSRTFQSDNMGYATNSQFLSVACQICRSVNATFHEEWCVITKVEKMQKKIEELERKIMSAAMWCDPGHHAFSANDEGIETLTRTKVVKDDNYGGKHDVTVQIHICSEHMKKLDPFGEHPDSENEVKKLEAWNDGWNAAKAGNYSVETGKDTDVDV